MLAPKPLETLSPKQNTFIVEKKEYYPTWLEWAANNREQIIRSDIFDSGVGSGENLYTVPAGYNFFITNIQMSITTNAASEGFVIIQKSTPGASYMQWLMGLYLSPELTGVMQNVSEAMEFPMPIRCFSGESVFVDWSNIIAAYGSFTLIGFLEPIQSG
jgi:hypothetical protein